MSAVGVALVVAVLCAAAAAAVRLAGGRRDDVRRRARGLFGGTGEADPAVGWRGERAWKWCVGRVVEGEAGRRWSFGRWGDVGREIWCLPAGLVLGVLGGSVLPLLASVAGLLLVRRWLAARGAVRARDRRAAAVIGLCAAVAGELRAGRQPAQALPPRAPRGWERPARRWWRLRGTEGTWPGRCGRRRGCRAPRG